VRAVERLEGISLSDRVIGTGVVAFGFGVLTAYAQGWLPVELGSLANTSGSWALIAFALSLMALRLRTAALIGPLTLLVLLVGYVVAQHVRSYSVGTSLIVFWSVVTLLVGPLLGVAAYWVRQQGGARAALGAGVISGVLIGEGIYGLTRIADTTYPPYWWAEVIVGVAIGAIALARAPRTPLNTGVGIATAAVTATAFVLVYGQDLIAVLP
jgi:hypothetical protein